MRAIAAASAIFSVLLLIFAGSHAKDRSDQDDSKGAARNISARSPRLREKVEAAPIAPFVLKGISWIVEAQHEDGGWGGGSHALQQQRDPHKVKTDPATTAFVGMALLRAGHTPVSGDHAGSVLRATEYLLRTVEAYDQPGPRITDITGTQPQRKLGPLVDTSMASLFLSKVLRALPEDHTLRSRVDTALEVCLDKLEKTQQEDGSWGGAGGGGWAPVLQSALSCAALEVAQASGKEVNETALRRARDYQKSNFNRNSGEIRTEAAAGVALYAFAGGQRAQASEAKSADELVDNGRRSGRLAADAPVTAANLEKLGVSGRKARSLEEAHSSFKAQNRRLDDEKLLAGFGNNGGEEYLSYLLTSESLVILGGEDWEKWNTKMHKRLAKIQSPDGSWTGHHCITSPVFCTAAAVQCLTADREAELLSSISEQVATSAQAR